MKPLTSSYSPSPSSSSTLSFDPTLCNSKTATAGCLTTILRRILCSGGLPTHPSDQIRELDSMVSGKDHEMKTKLKTEDANTLSSPGVVARLMGLDSMVEIPSEATPSTLSRSRSMNSVDYLGECKSMQSVHRRVKSSSSFREVPTFHLHENENFLVLSFESGCESKEFKTKGMKKGRSSGELKQKREEERELKKNKREKVHEGLIEEGNLRKRVSDMSSGNDGKLENFTSTLQLFKVSSEKKDIDSEVAKFSQPMKRNGVTNGEKVKRRKKKTCYTEKVEIECSSEDSSPVSVFDFEREAPGTELDSFGADLSWRRKLSPELEHEQFSILHYDSNLMIEGKVQAVENNKHKRPKNKEKQSQDYVDIWGKICRLVDDELVGSNQVEEGLRKQSELVSVSAEFESEIFDYLLNELIDQLVTNPLKTLQL